MAVAVLVSITLAANADGHHSKVLRTANAKGKDLRPGCYRHYTLHHFARYTHRRYQRRSSPLTAGQKVWITHLIRCVNTREKSLWAIRHRKRWRATFRARLAYYRLTPYSCGSAGRFAIPCYVVACESHYSWSAYNPSGAVGPYQLLGWGAPFPVRSWADRMAHHRIASRLWAGGAGASNWVCA